MAVLVLVFIAVCSVTSSFACMCMPDHPQKQFCNAGFVVRAKVVGPPVAVPMANYRDKFQVYRLRIISTFQGHANVQGKLVRYGNTFVANLYTPFIGSSCRVVLRPPTEYLVSGRIMEGHLYTSFCDWHQKWTELAPVQRAGVEGQYGRGCKCMMGFCFTPNCRDLLPGCGGFDRHYQCRAKYDRCDKYRDSKGVEKCGWQGNSQFQQCANGFGFPRVVAQLKNF